MIMRVLFFEVGPHKVHWESESDQEVIEEKFIIDQVQKMALISGRLVVVINDDKETGTVVAANGHVIGGFCVEG